MAAIVYSTIFNSTFSAKVEQLPVFFERPPYRIAGTGILAQGPKLIFPWKGRMCYTAPRIDENGEYVNSINSTCYLSNTGDYGHVPLVAFQKTDPTYGGFFPVGEIDEDITGLGQWGSYLIPLTERGLWRMEGEYGGDVTIMPIDKEHGCLSDRSVQSLNDGMMVWLGKQTVWALTPRGVEDIGKPLDKQLKRHSIEEKRQAISVYDPGRQLYVLSIPSIVSQRTFYVSNTGSDANDGLTASTPWQTIAKVNATTFLPGDNTLFNKDDVWREELKPISSGVEGNPIIFSSYGTGARPELNGSAVVANGDFTLHDTVPLQVVTGLDNATNDTASRGNMRIEIVAGYDSATVKLQLKASATNWDITSATISEQDTGSISLATPVQIKWGGSDATTITLNSVATSDEITFPVEAGHTYFISLWCSANRHYKGSTTFPFYYNSVFSANLSMEPDPNAIATMTRLASGGPVFALLGSDVQIYETPCATDPYAIWEDGQFLKTYLISNVKTMINGQMGSWFWDTATTTLYVTASESADVNDLLIPTNTKVYEKTSLRYNIEDNGQSWLEFSEINCSRSGTGITVVGVTLTGTHNIFHDMTIYSTFGHAMTIYTGAQDNLITNVIFRDSALTTVMAIYGNQEVGSCVRNVVDHCTFEQNNAMCIYSCIVLHGKSAENIIQYCDLSVNSNYQTSLIMTYDAGTSNTVRYNYLHSTHKVLHGIYLYGLGGPNYIYGNAIDMAGCDLGLVVGAATYPYSASAIYFSDTYGLSEVYDNDLRSDSGYYPLLRVVNTALETQQGVSFYNNRLFGTNFVSVDAYADTLVNGGNYTYWLAAVRIDNNTYQDMTPGTWIWQGTTDTSYESGWRITSGQDENSTLDSTITFKGSSVITTATAFSAIPTATTYVFSPVTGQWDEWGNFPDSAMLYARHAFTPGVYGTFSDYEDALHPIVRLMVGCTDLEGAAIDWHYTTGDTQYPDPSVSKTVREITLTAGQSKPESGETLLASALVTLTRDGVAGTGQLCTINAAHQSGRVLPNADKPCQRYALTVSGSTTTGGEIETIELIPTVRGLR